MTLSSTTSSISPTATANATAKVIVPQYTFKIGDASYFIPLCSDLPQTLWFTTGDKDHRKLHNFTLTCDGIVCDSGGFHAFPTEILFGDCQKTTICDVSFCFSRRFQWGTNKDNTVTCDEVKQSSRLRSRGPCSDNEVCSNITKIADKLAGLSNAIGSAGSAAEHGLSAVGCAAQQAFQQTAAYYFSMAQKQLSEIQKQIEFIKLFFTTLFGLNQQVSNPVNVWIDDNDEAFQELVCYIDDDGSRIWRTIEKHSTLHAGLNALSSINNIVNQNLIVVLIELIIKDLIQSLYDEYTAYLTSTGHIIQGWTQAWRLCITKWDRESLQNPEEEPDEDDDDEWLPRYQIFTNPDSSISSLRGLERVLDSEGWEASFDGNVFKGYVVDLNVMQSLLPKTMSFVDDTFRFVWEGPDNSSNRTNSRFSSIELADLEGFLPDTASRNETFGKTQDLDGQQKRQAFDPANWPAPTGSERMTRPYGSHLKSLSQQKGEDLSKLDYYTYAEPRGEGSWVFVIDSGFDTTHSKLASTDYRQVKTYIVPNEFVLPKLRPEHIAAGWKFADEVIDDNMPELNGRGHGTAVACVAGALDLGVASRTNLYLIKQENYMVNAITHETWQGYVTTTGLLEMTVKILDVIDKENIPYGRAVVTVNSDFPADSYYGKLYHYFFEELDKRGVVVVIAQGNGGYNKVTGTPDHYQGERSPQKFVTDASPFISVGATYHDGSVAEFSTPPGLKPGTSGPNADASVSIWAQGVGVYTCNPNSLVPMGYRSGTSFSAPIVAGLAAYMLSYPWPEKKNPFASKDGPSVGRRVKTMLADTYAYQRLPRDRLIGESMQNIIKNNPNHQFPWEVPAKVNVAYNMAYGDQKCKIVDGFPNLKRDGASCPVPGSGGADGESTGTIFYTDEPTYMPSDWSGFSSATGSIYTPSDYNATEPTATLTPFPPNTTTSWVITANSSTFMTNDYSFMDTHVESFFKHNHVINIEYYYKYQLQFNQFNQLVLYCYANSNAASHLGTVSVITAYKITEIRGDWALADSGYAFFRELGNCISMLSWQWHDPTATELAWMQINLKAGWKSDCITKCIKDNGGPSDVVCHPG
ncbi:hypothetical protein J7T55_006114 [Diaporthe amygdali]|uniref:uncharacterized protein n=1 Tax=Phomopsis amygdali TaxID=1214568 RepID=UPI0022FF438B|nr:uncharacterized protein J7T55_006114 [Diaporthe amygdali]KAJ0124773.1 hypothetical protein J7T55_006114 [Diaporthe amygdali]